MSYCRLSDDSDVSAVSTDTGTFIVLVAAVRTPNLPDATTDAMIAPQLWDWMQDNAVPIGGRYDGEVVELDSPQALVNKLRDLLVLGYRVPPSAWEAIYADHPQLRAEASLTTRALKP